MSRTHLSELVDGVGENVEVDVHLEGIDGVVRHTDEAVADVHYEEDEVHYLWWCRRNTDYKQGEIVPKRLEWDNHLHLKRRQTSTVFQAIPHNDLQDNSPLGLVP